MSRYYDSRSTDNIKPGVISAELREALNIPENDLPIWIYRMRALGYPPGWLKKAIVDTDDIFDTDESNKRKSPSPTDVQYDHSKLIEYPGFNSPMPQGCHDYHYYVNMPGMLEHQQLDYARRHMKKFKESENKSSDFDPKPVKSEPQDVNPSTPPVRLVSKGSPMPKPVERVDLVKFSEGVVGDLLYFENITNTGKFENIRELLKSVRKPSKDSSNDSKM